MDESKKLKQKQSQVTYLLLVVLIFLSYPVISKADDKYQSHDSIRQAVGEYVLKEMGATAELDLVRLDRRLKLHRCNQALSVFWPPGSRRAGSISVGVSCDDEKPWKIYVQSRVSVYRDVAVLSRPIARGDRIKRSDIKFEQRDISRLHGRYVEDVESVIGYEAVSSVNSDTLLRLSQFRAPKLVKRGQNVVLLAGTPGFQVKMSGKALSDGAAGDRVRVKNARSKKIVEGRILNNGQVKVD